MPDTKNPISNIGKNSCRFGTSNKSFRLKIPAPIITGIDIKNENLAASFRLSPWRTPPDIVDPDLEIPGKSDKT